MAVREYGEAYEAGRTFEAFVEAAESNEAMWRAMAARAPVIQQAAARIEAIPGTWRLLVLADDWCGDAVNTVPLLARLAEAAANLDLRIVGRDEWPGIMDRHLTGTSRSIPVAIALDADGRPRGWWGPRPRALQAWFEAEGRSLPKEARYRELRRWYARDRGVSTASEISDLIWCAAAGPAGEYRGTRPCDAAA